MDDPRSGGPDCCGGNPGCDHKCMTNPNDKLQARLWITISKALKHYEYYREDDGFETHVHIKAPLTQAVTNVAEAIQSANLALIDKSTIVKLQTPDPYDERDGVWMSLEDKEKLEAANLAVVDLDTQQRGVCNYNGPCEYRTALPTTKEPTSIEKHNAIYDDLGLDQTAGAHDDAERSKPDCSSQAERNCRML